MISELNKKMYDVAVGAIVAAQNITIIDRTTIGDFYRSIIYKEIDKDRLYLMWIDKDGIHSKILKES